MTPEKWAIRKIVTHDVFGNAREEYGAFSDMRVCRACGALIGDKGSSYYCGPCLDYIGLPNDDYDADESRWSPDGRGHTQVAQGELYPEDEEYAVGINR